MTMNFLESLRNCLTIKYCSVRGRASRSEYWWFLLFATVAGGVLEHLAEGSGSLSLAVDGSGIVCVLGVVGGIVFGLYFGIRKGTAPGEPNPYGGAPDSFNSPFRPSKPAPAQVEDFVLEEDIAPAACPNCGKPFAPEARFCGYCGHAWPSAPKCPSCGKELTDDSRFCTQCGAKLKD